MVLRYLLGNLLRNAAKQKVRETVVEAAKEQFREASEQPADSHTQQQPTPCHVGIVFAMSIESGCLEDRLDGMVSTRGHGFTVREGGLKGRAMALVRSGPGRSAAAKATEALIEGHQPQWVVSAGFAGGLHSKLQRNDILMADHLVDTSGNRLELDLKIDPAALAAVPGVHVGRLLTAEGIIRLPDEKRSLGEQYGAMAVDMETYAVAEVCRRRQVRFLAVRVISDAVDDELPPDVENLLKQKTKTAQLGAAAGAIWNRPSSAKDMYQLKENALLASERLAKFLVGIVEQL
ncbi:MAG: hypothetical protein V3R99_11260 [Thermoguttaceae bacterium]